MHFPWECVSLSLEIHLFIAVTPTAERADPQQDRLLLNLANKQFPDSTSRCFCGSGQRELLDSEFFPLFLSLSARKVSTRYRELT